MAGWNQGPNICLSEKVVTSTPESLRDSWKEPGIGFFSTPVGVCGLAWTGRGVDRLQLPDRDEAATRETLRALAPDRRIHSRLPASARNVSQRVARHLKEGRDPLHDVRLDLSACSTFARAVYRMLRRVEPGQTISYGELARRVGRPNAVRAVARVLAANPVPLLVPCHRVLHADRTLGGFSAPGGPALKARLLHAEGVHLDPRHAAGIAHLRAADPVLKGIIDRTGPCLLGLLHSRTPYESLFQAILYQQLSGKAAATIERRVRALNGKAWLPRPDELARISNAQLRGAGVSRQKSGYIRDLAAHVADGRLPLSGLRRMSDQDVIDRLTAVRGIGRWSAHMFLMFQLGRLDVLPVDDLGLRGGVGKAYGLGRAATPEEASRIGRPWAPYRSMGSWYMWRSLEAGGM